MSFVECHDGHFIARAFMPTPQSSKNRGALDKSTLPNCIPLPKHKSLHGTATLSCYRQGVHVHVGARGLALALFVHDPKSRQNKHRTISEVITDIQCP